MKRQWPFLSMPRCGANGSALDGDIQHAFNKWLQENLTEQELDRVAPKLPCEHKNVKEARYPDLYGYRRFDCGPDYYGHKCLDCGAKVKPKTWEAV
jgi:hypothetical protein